MMPSNPHTHHFQPTQVIGFSQGDVGTHNLASASLNSWRILSFGTDLQHAGRLNSSSPWLPLSRCCSAFAIASTGAQQRQRGQSSSSFLPTVFFMVPLSFVFIGLFVTQFLGCRGPVSRLSRSGPCFSCFGFAYERGAMVTITLDSCRRSQANEFSSSMKRRTKNETKTRVLVAVYIVITKLN